MLTIRARASVTKDGTLEVRVPTALPPGMLDALIVLDVPEQEGARLTLDDLPKHNLPWDDSISLRREDMYGDDGR